MAEPLIPNRFPGATSSPLLANPTVGVFAQASPMDREEAGFFVNPLEGLLSILGIPQQILYSFGKNIGELLTGNELTNQSFFDDVADAVQGRGRLSFADLMETVGAESLDLALPEGMTIDNPAIRIPTAVAAGVVSGWFTANPFLGAVSGFAMNDFLAGKGAVSSVVDIMSDPANKLRIFQRTAKGLGVTQKEFKEFSKLGVLGDKATLLARQKPLTGSLLSQVIKGERTLFDFSGNAGFLITPRNKMIQGLKIPLKRDMFDVGRWTGVNLFADTLDSGTHLAGRLVAKALPKGALDSVQKLAVGFEEKTIGRLTGFVARKIGDPLKSVFQVGADFSITTRKALEKAKKDLGDDDFKEFFDVLDGDPDALKSIQLYTKKVEELARQLAVEQSIGRQAAQAQAKRLIGDPARPITTIEQSRLAQDEAVAFASTTQKVLVADGMNAKQIEEVIKNPAVDLFEKMVGGIKLNSIEVETFFKNTGMDISPTLPFQLALDVHVGRIEDTTRLVGAGGQITLRELGQLTKKTNGLGKEIASLKGQLKTAKLEQKPAKIKTIETTIKDREGELKELSNIFVKGSKEQERMFQLMQQDQLKISRVEEKVITQGLQRLHPKFAKTIRVFLSNSKARAVPGSSTEFELGEALVKVIERQGQKLLQVNIQLHGLRSIDTMGNLLGEVSFGLLSEQSLAKAGSILKAGSAGELKQSYIKHFTSLMNGSGVSNDITTRGFFGRMHDVMRGVMNYFKDALTPGSFKDKRVQRKFFRWLKGEDFTAKVEDFNGLDKISDIRTVIKDGKVISPLELKDYLKNQQQIMVDSTMLPKDYGIRPDANAAVAEPLNLKQAKGVEKLSQHISAVALNQYSRGNIGTRNSINFQRTIKDSDELKQAILDTKAVPKQQLDDFLAARDLEGFNIPGHIVNETINAISSRMLIKPMENFETGVAALFEGIQEQTRNKAFINTLDNVIQNLTFNTEKNEKARLLNAIMDTIDKVYINRDDSARIADALRAGRIGAKPKDQAAIQNVVELWATSKNKSISGFNNLVKETTSLVEDGILPRHAGEELAATLKTLGLEGPTAAQGRLVNQELIDAVAAERRLAAGADDALPAGFESIFFREGTEGITDGAVRQLRREIDKKVFAGGSIEDALGQDLEGIATFAERAGPVFIKESFKVGKTIPEKDLRRLNNWKEFKAGKDASPAVRKFDGKFLPVHLMPFLTGENTAKSVEQMSELGKMYTRLVRGIPQEMAQDRAEQTVKFLNDIIPGKPFGDKSLDLAERFYAGANFDYLTTLFKSQALLSGAFHVRNAISAFYTNTSAGVDLRSHEKAFKTLVAGSRLQAGDVIRQSDGTLKFSSRVKPKDRELLERFIEAEEGGALSGGLSAEVREESGIRLQQGAATSFNPVSVGNFIPYDINFKVAGRIEDFARVAAFNHAIDNLGMSVKDAGDYLRLLHFDYNILTNIEKKFLKRLIPFYTYFRKAIVRDSRLFMERTGEFVKMGHLIQSAERGIEPEQSDALSQYITEQLGVRVRKNDQGKVEYLLLGGLIPAADLVSRTIGALQPGERLKPTKVLSNIVNSFAEGLTPLVKIPAEQYLNLNFYFGKPIEKYQGELADLYGIAVPARFVHLIQSVRVLNDLNRVSKALRLTPSPTRPDIRPAGQDFNTGFRELLGVLGGIRVVENSSPGTQLYFNRILPRKQAIRQAKSNVRSEARRGPGNANLPVTLGILRKTVQEEQQKVIQRQTTQQKILQQSAARQKVLGALRFPE